MINGWATPIPENPKDSGFLTKIAPGIKQAESERADGLNAYQAYLSQQ